MALLFKGYKKVQIRKREREIPTYHMVRIEKSSITIADI
jgi:hypothetical protein